jgi:hypothetical protein
MGLLILAIPLLGSVISTPVTQEDERPKSLKRGGIKNNGVSYGLTLDPISLATSAFFLANAIMGMIEEAEARNKNKFYVRLWAGKGEEGEHHGGSTPSFGAINVNGKVMGEYHTNKNGEHIRAGNWRDIVIHTPKTNERAE